MRIVHRIGLNSQTCAEEFANIQSLGIQYRSSPSPAGDALIVFEIDEADPRWPEVSALARAKSLLDLVDTVFSKEEILQAEWLRAVPRNPQGYPYPRDDMAWVDIVYAGECPRCGIGFRQKAPFHLDKEPRPGKKDFMSLFWTHTLFCTPRVIETLELQGIRGYEVWPAIIHHTGQPAKSVSQLVVSAVSRSALSKEDKQQPDRCWRCWKVKYAFHLKGYMHLKRQSLHTDVDLQLTHEWFGTGTRTGYQEILISQRLARLILQEKWRGLALKPVMLV